MSTSSTRPKYLNLLRIKMPVGAVASIAHRASGILLFLAIPFLIYWFDLSLRSEETYAQAIGVFASPLAKLVSLAIVWALAHHLLAGIRFLLLDLHIGMDRDTARFSAWLVNIGGALLAVAYLVLVL